MILFPNLIKIVTSAILNHLIPLQLKQNPLPGRISIRKNLFKKPDSIQYIHDIHFLVVSVFSIFDQGVILSLIFVVCAETADFSD